jgi:hypothetical protein
MIFAFIIGAEQKPPPHPNNMIAIPNNEREK